MTTRTLKFAGLLAMASAFLTLPLVYLTYSLDSRVDVEATLIKAVIQIFGIILFIAIVTYLKKLLNTFFKFHDTDRNIDLMIIANMVAGVLSTGVLYFAQLQESISLAIIAILVMQGIVQVQFGYKLLKLPNDLGGMLKPFCYANMATGMLLASIVLLPAGILVSAMSDLMLGTIFFNLSKVTAVDDLKKG